MHYISNQYYLSKYEKFIKFIYFMHFDCIPYNIKKRTFFVLQYTVFTLYIPPLLLYAQCTCTHKQSMWLLTCSTLFAAMSACVCVCVWNKTKEIMCVLLFFWFKNIAHIHSHDLRCFIVNRKAIKPMHTRFIPM